MVNTSQVAAAAALLALGSAMPTKRSTTISQVQGQHKQLNGQGAYLKALRKYGGSQQKIGQVLADPGSVTATSIDGDLEYVCPVQISGQTFQLDFDTGSSDLWVFGPNAGASGHTVYQAGPDSQPLDGASWEISYGDGSSASGTVVTDTVTIGNTVVTGQAVEIADKAADQFLQGKNDGLVGLAFDQINTVKPQQQKTFFSNAIDQGLQPVITVDLRKGEAGSYTFGDIPADLISGEPAYTPIDDSQGFWMFTPDSASIGGQPVDGNLAGIADTGTTLLLLGSDVVDAYYQQVQGAQQTQGQYVVPCDAQLPDFSTTVGGYEAVVPGSYINYADNGDGTCYGGIQEASGLPFGIYGDIWLKSQVVVFDAGQKQLGVAAKAGGQ